MKWILKMNQKYVLSYVLSNLFLIFFDTIGFVFPIAIGYMVDEVVIHQNTENLLLMTIFLICMIIFKQVGAYISWYKVEMVTLKMQQNIKVACYQKINQMDHYFFEHNSKGELMTNFTSDMWMIRKHICYNIKTIGAVVLTFLFSFAYLLHIHALFTFLLLIPGFFIGIASFLFVKKMGKYYEKLRNVLALDNNYIEDNIEGNKVVKTFALEKNEIQTMSKLDQNYIDLDMDIGFMEDRYYAIVDFLSHITSAIFLLGGGYLFINGWISLGKLIIFNAYLYNLRAPFIRLSGLMNSIQKYIVASKRIRKLLDAKPRKILTGTQHISSLLKPIEFRDVQIVYDDRVVVDHLNIRIEPYETIAFVGKTGSGKSSIVNLLLGLITPNKGEILIDGENYLNYDIQDIRQRIGYVTQNPFLFSDTIYHNISYGATGISKKDALEYADIACCDYVHKLEDGIDTIIGERGVGLSGGEKQRLSLARALAVRPDILLLDDITSALDIETEEKINESIQNLDYKATKVIIAGKIVSVMNADRIYVLDEGRVVEEGTHLELLHKKGYYYELYQIQKGDI